MKRYSDIFDSFSPKKKEKEATEWTGKALMKWFTGFGIEEIEPHDYFFLITEIKAWNMEVDYGAEFRGGTAYDIE